MLFLRPSGYEKIEKFQKECENLGISSPSLRKIEKMLIKKEDLKKSFSLKKTNDKNEIELKLIVNKDFSIRKNTPELNSALNKIEKFKTDYTLNVKNGLIKDIDFYTGLFRINVKFKNDKVSYYVSKTDPNYWRSIVEFEEDLPIEKLGLIGNIKKTLEKIIKIKNLNGVVRKSEIDESIEELIINTLRDYECNFFYGYNIKFYEKDIILKLKESNLMIHLKKDKTIIGIDSLNECENYIMSKSKWLDRFLREVESFDKVLKQIDTKNIKILSEDFVEVDERIIVELLSIEKEFIYRNQKFFTKSPKILNEILKETERQNQIKITSKQNELEKLVEKILKNIDCIRIKDKDGQALYEVESDKNKIVINEKFNHIEIHTVSKDGIKLKLDAKYLTIKNQKSLYRLYAFIHIIKHQSKNKGFIIKFDKKSYMNDLNKTFERLIYMQLKNLIFQYNGIKNELQVKVGEYLYITISDKEIQIHHSIEHTSIYIENLDKFFIKELKNVREVLEKLKTKHPFTIINKDLVEVEIGDELVTLDRSKNFYPAIKVGNCIITDLIGHFGDNTLIDLYFSEDYKPNPNKVLQNFVVRYKNSLLKIIEIDKVNKTITFEDKKSKEIIKIRIVKRMFDFALTIKSNNKYDEVKMNIDYMQENQLFFDLFLLID